MARSASDRPFEPLELQMMFEALGLGTEADRAAFRRLAAEEKPGCQMARAQADLTRTLKPEQVLVAGGSLPGRALDA